MVEWLPLFLFMASSQAAAPATHKVDIHIAGPVAMVEVWRSVDPTPRTVGNRQTESTLDLSLPEKAALVDWEIVERGEHARMAQQSEGQVSVGLAAVLKMRQISPSTAPADEATGYRLHLTPLAESPRPVVHYRYTMPVACSDGKLILRMPESLEDNPVPAEVTVTFEPHPDGFTLAQASLAGKPAEIRGKPRRWVMRGLSPARAAWDVSWAFSTTHAGFPGQALVAVGPIANKGATKALTKAGAAALVCVGSTEVPRLKADAPGSVMLLLDRSRSVGQGGLSEERVFARALLEALPPSVPFNAILFGETVTPLFPIPRMPTREALEALSSAADPNRLEKTTDVVAALERARKGLSQSPDGQTWIVIVTDGALPANQTAARMQEALSGVNDRKLRVLVMLVRQRGDDEVGKTALGEYARLAERFGGLIREVPSGSADEIARAAVGAMARGGDWFGVRFDDTQVADVLPAGRGQSTVFAQDGRKDGRQNGGKDGRAGLHRKIRFTARGAASPGRPEISTIHVDLTPATVKGDWLHPLLETDGSKRRAWAGATSSVAVAVLPSLPAPKRATDEVVHGRLDETVLRNALSLAFMPRARACYLSRRVATANDAHLRGRVRLELTIERGELHDAVIRKSTLDHPDIEACLRNAAWAVDYPRPEHRDALTVANLNLVFRPRTGDEKQPDASALDREIELVLGPLTFTQDFSDLLDDKPVQKSGTP
jgi:hypothetical protein